jgi:cell division septal protein FtsQ
MGGMMTKEQKQPGEQIASHIYKRPASTPTRRRKKPAPGEGSYRVMREMEKGSSSVRDRGQAQTRNVTMPESVPPTAWKRYAERRDHYQSSRSHARGQTQTKLAARTLAQTGTRVPDRQIRIPPRSLPGSYSSPVPRRSGKQRSKRRGGFLWKVLGLFGIVGVLVLGSSFALSSSAFRVEQVNVVGTHNDALEQQIQQMGMQGQNIFLIDIAALTARIDNIPMVASASLQKQWPNQLQVTVTERVPVLLWQTSNGTYGVDGQGFVIAPASETTGAAQLMAVKDMRTYQHGGKGAAERIQPGDHLNEANIAFAASVFTTLPKLTKITNFTLLYNDAGATASGQEQGNVGGNGSFVVASQAGWQAYLGGPGDANPLSNRLIELQNILALAQQQQLTLATIDLRYGLRPVYTVKS